MGSTLFPNLIVNGETIPHATIAAEAQNHTAPSNKPGLAWRMAANALAVRTLLLQEAGQRNLTPEPREITPGRYETTDENLINLLLESEIHAPPPSKKAVFAEWEKNSERFRSPPLWEVSHILFSCAPENVEKADLALARAVECQKKLQDQVAGFESLAKTESDCASKKNDGRLGQIGPGDTLPEFEKALRTLHIGDITSTPIKTKFGYHIIRLDAEANGQILPFAAVEQRLTRAMEKAAWAKSAQELIARLTAAAEISGADLSHRSHKGVGGCQKENHQADAENA